MLCLPANSLSLSSRFWGANLEEILRNRTLVQEIQLGLGFFQRFKSGLQMRSLKIVKVRPAKHVVDYRFGSVNPFLRPAQDGERKRPSGRIAVDAGARSGHGW
jgi:hypothetical protein